MPQEILRKFHTLEFMSPWAQAFGSPLVALKVATCTPIKGAAKASLPQQVLRILITRPIDIKTQSLHTAHFCS